MGSGGESVSDLRLKVLYAEDRLIAEKNNLHELRQKYADMKLRWDEEVKEVEGVVQNLQKEVKLREERLEKVKEELQEVFGKIREIDEQIEREENEKKKIEREHEIKKNKNVEDFRLRRELKAVQQMRKDLLLSSKFMKEIQQYESLQTEGGEGGYRMKEEFEELWNDIEEKLKIHDQTMRELDDMSLNGLRQNLEDLREYRAKLEADYEKVEQKNKEMEQKIKRLEEEEEEKFKLDFK